ncbi:ABC transporter substrate-binding protein [Kribbella soli]|uniref:Carbohydrate ABC transporter substrate-binding protein n=1 Tax=Kribbella soli TaxID=1124743 RepID=A0A4R0HA57_9ACTN|nr:ABC transporter substrate-binding protein [Kribbella soli]TCC07777.1 carbohydrate ABC transporter substrate-binding protein [Kribbella soli]
MRRRVGSAVLALACLVGAAACTNPGTGNDQTSAAVTWPAETEKLDGVTLTIWAAQNSNTIPKAVIGDFQAATGAKVNVVTIPDPYEQGVQTKVASGDKPDLAFWQPTASQLTALNASTNLQVLDGAPWVDKFKPALRDITGMLDGKRYAALISSPAVEGVYYNKQVLAKYGVTSLPKNFDELIATAKTIKAKGGTPFYEMGGDRWATQWWVQVQLADAAKAGLWDKVNKNEEKFTDPTILNAIKKYKELVDQGLFNSNITSATFDDQGKALLAGDAAMVIQVNSFFSQLQAKAKTDELNQKIGFFPISPSGNVGTFIPDQSNALVAFKTGDAKREAAARQLMSFWLGSEYPKFLADQNTVSLETDVPSPGTVPDALNSVSDSLTTAVGSMQALAVANPDLYLNLANMLGGKMTPEQVASTTQAQFAQLAKAMGTSGF